MLKEFTNSEQPKKKLNSSLKVAFLLLILGLIVSITFNIMQYRKLTDYKTSPQKLINEQESKLIEKVKKLYQFPSYVENIDDKEITKQDTPTLAKVIDKDKLVEQAFFAKAENNDYILVFPNAKMALIYRESTNQIINSGPLVFESSDLGN